MTTDKAGEPLYPRDAMIAAGEETARWIQKTTELRSAVSEMMQRSWEGGLDDEEVQGILEKHELLVTVPSDWNTLMEYETSTMLGLAWETIREHEKHFDGHVYTGDCIWCGVPGDMADTPPCIVRLKTETYQEALDQGAEWDADLSVWVIGTYGATPEEL